MDRIICLFLLNALSVIFGHPGALNRSDVYIAGFFPYNSTEKAEIGNFYLYYILPSRCVIFPS